MILTIASSDKLTLSMFSDFYKSIYSSEVYIVDLNCLYAAATINSIMEDIEKISLRNRVILIKYKMKPKTKEIHDRVIELSDAAIRFDIFSTEPEILKDKDSQMVPIIDRWKKNIEILNKQKI